MRIATIATIAAALWVGGCSAGDPCEGQAGACIALTVTSTTVTRIDALRLSAFGDTRTSSSEAAALPVRLAVVPPANTSGRHPLAVQGLLAGAVVGAGVTAVDVGAGTVAATVALAGGGGCGDTTSDPLNCGRCGHDCNTLPNVTGPGATCSAGACVIPRAACRAGFAHCSANPDDGCEADLSQPAHCGGCATRCPAATPLCSPSGASYACTVSCAPPQPTKCGDQCVDLLSNPQHCKTCGNACSFPHAGAVCTQGVCSLGACASGYRDCVNGPADGCETYVAGDPQNCGACGRRCLVGQVCNSGTCAENQVTCASPGVSCAQSSCFDAGHFSVSSGIVADLKNGRRLWERRLGANGAKVSWFQARTYCQTLVLEGINSWRLPSYTELSQIAYKTGGLQGCDTARGYCDPALDQAAFPGAAQAAGLYVWSTDQDTRLSPPGYYTYFFCDGRKNYSNDPTSGSNHVRCTHDPLP